LAERISLQKEKLLFFIIRKLNRIIPKKKNQIIFESAPDFSDNSNSMFNYIKNNKKIKSQYSLIWLVNDKKLLKTLKNEKIEVYSKNSLKGLYSVLRSKFIFNTHTSFVNIKSENQVLINLWHGMPLKSMGFNDSSESDNNLKTVRKMSQKNDILIATSTIMKNLLASCFYMDPRKIYVTGQPRNDKLFINNKQKLSQLLNLDVSNYKKIVLFSPTFRKWGSKVDGISRETNIFGFEDYNSTIFNNFLEEQNILFLLKIHPFEEKYYLSKLNNNSKNMVLITQNRLKDNLLDLYDILGAIDILITDYSSIYFDFLLLNRPIIFIPTDLKEYSKSRGFLLEPYDFWTPGPKILKFKDLIEELKKIEETDYKKERIVVNSIINKYQDKNSCKRIFELFIKD
jgi:CDP-glycerol glycerophosphotransferase